MACKTAVFREKGMRFCGAETKGFGLVDECG